MEQDDMLNIVLPMAGKGSRFAEKGYAFPKPLIEIKKKPMIQVVIENLTPKEPHRFIFICQKSHYNQYSLQTLLEAIAPGCKVVVVDGITEGAACTVLLAKEFIDNDDELLLANSDQFVDLDINKFLEGVRKDGKDGSIMTFESLHPKWSYAKLDGSGNVIEVAEKKPISHHATVGIYYYKKGTFFVKGAEDMIMKNIRTNNEFYVCPVYNQMIEKSKKVGIFEIEPDQMYGLGTPEDLEMFKSSEMMKRV
jgi:dTDP-glucose pyrophosphorylase